MRITRQVTINVAYGVVPVTATATPKSYVGSWTECFVDWTPIAPKVGHNVLFEWGDGESDLISNLRDPSEVTESHNYQAAGTYTITVTVTDQYNNKGVATTSTVIADKVVGFLDADVSEGFPPLLVTFTFGMDLGFGPYNWSLNFGDGSTPVSGTDPAGSAYVRTHEYVEKGLFTATLTVEDQLGAFLSVPVEIGIALPTIPELAWWQWALIGLAALSGVGAAFYTLRKR